MTADAQPTSTDFAIADRRAEARQRGYVGYSCLDCGNFTFVRNGACLECDTSWKHHRLFLRRQEGGQKKQRRDCYRIAVARRKGADAEPLRWSSSNSVVPGLIG